MSKNSSHWYASLLEDVQLFDEFISLKIREAVFKIKSNSFRLMQTLESYYSHLIADSRSEAIEILTIERTPVSVDLEFIDWEPGIKIFELDDGRIVKDEEGGMLFLQSPGSLVAVGPCEENPEKIIHFINSQYSNFLHKEEWAESSASAIEIKGIGVGICGGCSTGKSTLTLELMEDEEARFLSDGGVFVRDEGIVVARGLPILPSICRGTQLENYRLRCMLPSYRIEELESKGDSLWDRNCKTDVDITSVYGIGRIVQETALQYILVLNWSKDSEEETTIKQINCIKTPGILEVLQAARCPFLCKESPKPDFPNLLKEVEIHEISGGMNLEVVKDFILKRATHS